MAKTKSTMAQQIAQHSGCTLIRGRTAFLALRTQTRFLVRLFARSSRPRHEGRDFKTTMR